MGARIRFAYSGVTADGSKHSGFVVAASRDEAARMVRSEGLLPLTLDPRRSLFATRPIPIAERAEGLETLGGLLSAGLSLPQALQAFEDLAPMGWREELPSIEWLTAHGIPLYDTLGSERLGLPPEILGLVKVGGESGNLAEALTMGGQLLSASSQTRAALRDVLAYPALLTVAGGGTVLLLVTKVLPQFADLLTGSGTELPLLTQLLLSVGQLDPLAIFAAVTAVPVAMAAGLTRVREGTARLRWHRLLLGLPVVDPIRHSLATDRSLLALSTLLRSGVPLSAALPLAAEASGDAVMEQRYRQATALVADGERLSSALLETQAVTPAAGRLCAVGEQTGRLPDLLRHGSVLERSFSLRRIRGAVRVLEPSLILFFGIIVAVVAGALLQAVYAFAPLQ